VFVDGSGDGNDYYDDDDDEYAEGNEYYEEYWWRRGWILAQNISIAVLNNQNTSWSPLLYIATRFIIISSAVYISVWHNYNEIGPENGRKVYKFHQIYVDMKVV